MNIRITVGRLVGLAVFAAIVGGFVWARIWINDVTSPESHAALSKLSEVEPKVSRCDPEEQSWINGTRLWAEGLTDRRSRRVYLYWLNVKQESVDDCLAEDAAKGEIPTPPAGIRLDVHRQ